MRKQLADDQLLRKVRNELQLELGYFPRSYDIRDYLKRNHNIDMNDSTIRGRFIQMGEPLRGGGNRFKRPPEKVEQPEKPEETTVKEEEIKVDQGLSAYIPNDKEFESYICRDIDKRLATHYDIGYDTGRYKYPITQGKQGTGKTFSHAYYAWSKKLPFFLFSCYEDFKLSKLFGDKTIKDGSVKFQESLFVKAIQSPSVILFDEVNAVSNVHSFDFHALLQNRELFIKDADDGNGKTYRLHPQCRIGFAQNPKSAKYLGGNIKPSNFLGRCTFITYPEFSTAELKNALKAKFPKVSNDKITEFVKFYREVTKLLDNTGVPMDVSIRQLVNVVDLWCAGLDIQTAIDDGLASMTEACSQPTAKEAIQKQAMLVFKELLPPPMTKAEEEASNV